MSESVFATDRAALSNDDVATLLTSKVHIAPDARLAVLELSDGRSSRYDAKVVSREQQEQLDRFMDEIATANKIQEAFQVPGMLRPVKPSFSNLRSTAARCQADLILVYGMSESLRATAKFLAPDEVEASCTIDAILLDTRTGTVQFTSRSSQSVEAAQADDDKTPQDTLRRVRLECGQLAFEKVADDLVRFLNAST